MRKLRVILSIDGGGVRGILPLVMLNYIQQNLYDKDLCNSLNKDLDLLSGTSTGAIISAALMLENNGVPVYNPENILNLYLHRGKQIFNPDRADNVNSLQLVLDHNFGHLKVSDLSKHFLFLSYDKNAEKPYVFTNRQAQFRDVSLAKILLACSAIPGYFPPVNLGCYSLVDGIYAAKNPAFYAYQHAKISFPDDPILLLSMGTGVPPIAARDNIELEVSRVEHTMEDIAQSDRDLIYYRFQPNIEQASYAMDDSSKDNLEALIIDGENYISSMKVTFKKLFSDWKEFKTTTLR